MLRKARGKVKELGAADRLRIVVLGYLVRGPLGGMAWHHLQYVMGLARLGHEVYFIEDSGDSPWCCYDPTRDITDADPAYGLEFAACTFSRAGLENCWAYYDAHTSRWRGPCAERIHHVCATTDLLLDLGGVNPVRPWMMGIPRRVLVDTDPVFTQIRHLTNPAARQLALQHTAFFSFGENFESTQYAIPDDGLPWRRTRQPIVMDAWQVSPGPAQGRFTTVMQWESYPAAEYGDVCYGVKSDSFEPFMDLPARVGPILELAIGSPTAPRPFLESKGWILRDPIEVAPDPWSYQRYIQQSKAEFTVAKHGYVVSRSGWFSERSAAYLASGRPVVTQETGFSDWLEAGSGVIPFTTPDESIAAIEDVNSRYEVHCRAARAVAEAYFDSDRVLEKLIEEAWIGDR
jgi:hypothetical protein